MHTLCDTCLHLPTSLIVHLNRTIIDLTYWTCSIYATPNLVQTCNVEQTCTMFKTLYNLVQPCSICFTWNTLTRVHVHTRAPVCHAYMSYLLLPLYRHAWSCHLWHVQHLFENIFTSENLNVFMHLHPVLHIQHDFSKTFRLTPLSIYFISWSSLFNPHLDWSNILTTLIVSME